jgi:Ca-activated chloride channel homolog
MFRSRVWVRRLVAAGVPALLLVVLVGCGAQQNAEVARREAEQAEAARKETDAQRVEVERLQKELGELRKAKDDLEKPQKDAVTALDALSKSNPKTSGHLHLADPVAGLPPAGGTVPMGISPGTPATGYAPPGLGAASGPVPFPGRSSASKAKLLAAGGGAPKPSSNPGDPGNQKQPAQGGDDKAGAKGDPKDAAEAKPDGKLKEVDERAGQNAEAYGVYAENEFRSPLVAPLSTFSADVNTASYSNIRRYLGDGQLPPASAVFLAEFVNYFPYSYAQPKGDDPVAFHVEMGPCPWNRKHHLVRVGLQAYQIPEDKMPPRNLVFLIDTSGSMSSPNRLPLVKQSLNLLVDKLVEQDRVSIVTYAGDSRVALGPTRGTEKDTIKDIITNLQAQGSTNGEGGIKNAYRLARETFIDGGVNRVILCTDGDFNVGVTGQGELVRMIEEQRRSKVFLTILGFGMGNYKDETLKELANHGNGHHAYIDTLDEAKKLFVDQGGALVCVAKDVKFQVDFNPAKVAAYRLIGYENRLLKDEDFKNDAKDAGDMGSGHQVTVLYEIIPMGVSIDLPGVDKSKYTVPLKIDANAPDEWLTVKMRYKHPEADVSKELAKPLAGKALGQDLSDDFRFAAAAASFGMILRDSQFRGGMTYAGVLEEAQGCVKNDPGGHRKEFLELVKRARDLAAPKVNATGGGSSN